MPVGFEPMKGKPTDALPDGKDWVYEPKYNGFRAVVGHHSGGVWLEIGSNTARSAQVPYINEAVGQLTYEDTILDGELVALNPDGTQDWGRVQTILRSTTKIGQHKPSAASPALTFVVFDILVNDGEDLRATPYAERRAALEALPFGDVEHVQLSPVGPPTEAFYESCVEQGFEGIMAKRVKGRYRCGKRSADIRKVKVDFTIDVVVTEIYPSDDASSWIAQEGLPGKLGFGYWDHDLCEPVELSRVGTGFSKIQRADIRDNPDEWLGAVIEVRAFEQLDSGKVRHPAFVRRRDDKQPGDCVFQDVESDAPATAEVAGEPDTPIRDTAVDSPARSASGNIRNIAQMKDDKLIDLAQRMVGSTDVEALERVMAEMRKRGHA